MQEISQKIIFEVQKLESSNITVPFIKSNKNESLFKRVHEHWKKIEKVDIIKIYKIDKFYHRKKNQSKK